MNCFIWFTKCVLTVLICGIKLTQTKQLLQCFDETYVFASQNLVIAKKKNICHLHFRIWNQQCMCYLREVGPPPNTKRRQNSLNRLCSVCAGLCCKKNCLCCFVFLDIKIIFIGHSEVTQPPHIVQIHPR